jgi:hypothetical protein
MAGRECYHCKQWIEEGQAHDCWTTTEAALTGGLSEDLQDAWARLRETAAAFGEQRIYASLNSIMFSRKSCYFFVRPKVSYLEVCFFLGRTVNAPQIRRVEPASKVKMVHFVRIRHRDEVEPPLTDWLREAYELQDRQAVTAAPAAVSKSKAAKAGKPASKPARTAGATARKATGRDAKKAGRKPAARTRAAKAVARPPSRRR